jgi:hypothetical protein
VAANQVRNSAVKTLRDLLGLVTIFLPEGCDDGQVPCKVTKILEAVAKRLVGQAYDDLAAVQKFWRYFRSTDSILCLRNQRGWPSWDALPNR